MSAHVKNTIKIGFQTPTHCFPALYSSLEAEADDDNDGPQTSLAGTPRRGVWTRTVYEVKLLSLQ